MYAYNKMLRIPEIRDSQNQLKRIVSKIMKLFLVVLCLTYATGRRKHHRDQDKNVEGGLEAEGQFFSF